MLNFLTPKSKLQMHTIKEIPVETLEVIGVSQINPYCGAKYENSVIFTVVNFANCDKNYDEKETIVLQTYFEKRRCPKCKKISLVPTKIRINFDPTYLKNEEEIAYDAYSEEPSKVNSPSYALGYCSSCSNAFEIRLQSRDYWIRQAKKLKDANIVIPWQEYQVDVY